MRQKDFLHIKHDLIESWHMNIWLIIAVTHKWGRVSHDINNMLSLTLVWYAISRAIINARMSSSPFLCKSQLLSAISQQILRYAG